MSFDRQNVNLLVLWKSLNAFKHIDFISKNTRFLTIQSNILLVV